MRENETSDGIIFEKYGIEKLCRDDIFFRMNNDTFPSAYFITFTTYGTWVHADARGSVNRNQNEYDTPRIKPNAQYAKEMHDKQKHDQFILSEEKRETILQSIIEACKYYHWYLHAAHVRTNHVHILLCAKENPDTVTTKIKSYATRFLKKNHPDIPDQKFWTRGKSARYIWNSTFIVPVMQYIVEHQGKKMAWYCEGVSKEINGIDYE